MKYIVCFLLLITTLSVSAQTKVIGTVVDSNGSTLPGASVVLLQKSDSVLQSFAVSAADGSFFFKNIPGGTYILQVSFLGYRDLSKEQVVDSKNKEFNLGEITLLENSKVLDEVSVTAERIPIIIKEDTIEYNAAAFKTKPNASVEDLLKKLPGVEVESDGTIRAQGETVNKVLVDGKEFFGDDPKLATRNLSSDAVDKVQVFDKLSEMAEFSGVDDGNKSKTINLSLKEDRKKGAFGKLNAGFGTNERYSAKANINKFNKRTQLSFLGSTNNLNQQDFSIQDYINFSGGLSQLAGNGGRISLSDQGGSLGLGNRKGINTSRFAGVNYNHDLEDKSEVSISYFFNNLAQELSRKAKRDNFINNQTFLSADTSNRTTKNYNHRLNLRFKKIINKQSDITFRSMISLTRNESNSANTLSSFDAGGLLQNESTQSNKTDNDGHNINGSMLYRRKFSKRGRALTANIEANVSSANGFNLVNSNNLFYTNESLTEQINIAQDQNQLNDQTDYKMGMTYTEPLGGRKYLQLNYTRQNYDSDLEKDFFDRLSDGSRLLNTELSTRYTRDYFYNRGGLNLLSNFKKSTLNVGINAQKSTLKGKLTEEDLQINRDFFNLLPSLRWRIEFAQSKSMTIEYSTAVNEPSLQQLQPFVDNSDPLRIYEGNPDLKVEYRHNIRLNYLLFDNFSFTNLFFMLNTTITSNRITNATTIDEFLKQTVRPVNIGEEVMSTSHISFGTPIKPVGMKVNLTINNTAIKTRLFVNELENDVTRWINNFDLRLENRKKKILDFTIGGKISLNDTKYSNNSELDQNFVNRTIYGSCGVDFLKKWNINTSFDYSTYAGDVFNNNQEVTLWHAEISRSFLKSDKGQLKLSVFDLLNQNRGVERNSSFNYIEDERYNAIGRYLLASFTYSIR